MPLPGEGTRQERRRRVLARAARGEQLTLRNLVWNEVRTRSAPRPVRGTECRPHLVPYEVRAQCPPVPYLVPYEVPRFSGWSRAVRQCRPTGLPEWARAVAAVR